MKKAHLYEAIVLVNRGIDEAVQGLERLGRAKNSGLDPACLTEKLTLFELHRASLNSYLCSKFNGVEQTDLIRFEKLHREFEDIALDEVQVYRDLRAVEERRRKEAKPPKVRFLTDEEQRVIQAVSSQPSSGASEDSGYGAGGQRG